MKFKTLSGRMTLCRSIEDYTDDERRALWPPAKPLRAEHLRNCRILENREVLLEQMPKNAVCAELGILRCEFSEKILRITHPKKLHLIDRDGAAISAAKKSLA